MKKGKILAWVAALCAATLLTGLLAACDDGGENNGGEPQTYTVTAAESEDYTLTPDKTSAAAGDTVTVTAEMKNTDKYLTGVKYNEEDCDEEDGKYTFTMPAANVTLTAVTEAYEEVLDDGMATFASLNTKTIAKTETADTATLLVLFDQNYMTGIKYEIASSDESVIPVSAITVKEVTNSDLVGSSGSSVIEQAEVDIDTSKVSLGSTWLTMYFKGTAGSSASGTIVVKITVEEKVEDWDITLIFDVSDLGYDDGAEYTITLVASSGISANKGYHNLVQEDGKVTVQIKYTPGVTYGISFFYVDTDQLISYYLDEAYGEGTTAGNEGFIKYEDGKLSCVENNTSLEIYVRNEVEGEYPKN